MSTPVWVVGSGGLLGSSVLRAVKRDPAFEPWGRPSGRFCWEDAPRLRAELADAARAFLSDAGHEGRRPSWAILWCAGAGVVGTPARALAAESQAWEHFLDSLDSGLAGGPGDQADGILFLASSAGGVYSGGTEVPATESSPCYPPSAYGEAKLRQERALARWSDRHPRVSTLVARISNLYGPGQDLQKPQGLISHMTRCLIYRRPVHIYVPLDTVRDYLFAEDAGVAIARWVRRLQREAAQARKARHVLKICASEQDTTVSALVGLFRRLARREVKVITGLHPLHALQPRQLRFRSEVWLDEPPVARVSLLDGLSRVHRHQLALYQAGRLPPPSSQLPLAASQRPRANP